MRQYTVVLPLPSRHLTPNTRRHWRLVQKATKEAKETAFFTARSVLGLTKPLMDKCEVSMAYDTTKDKFDRGYRPFDVQNAISAVKAYVDGCRQAGIVVDDSAKHLSWGKCEIVKEGKPGVTLVFRETA